MDAADHNSYIRRKSFLASRQVSPLVGNFLGVLAALGLLLSVAFIFGEIVSSSIEVLLLKGFSSPVIFSASNILSLIATGLFFALLAVGFALPFAIVTAILLFQESKKWWSRSIFRFFRALAFLPPVVSGSVFCWFFGPVLQNQLRPLWNGFFHHDSLFAQIVAFALTILFYPLTIFFDQAYSTEVFFRQTLVRVVDIGQGSFSVFLIVLILTLLLIPFFVNLVYRSLLINRDQSHIDVALSFGATEWEALRLTLVQTMRRRFFAIFCIGVAKAFVEGTSVFMVLNFFFLSGNWHRPFWAETFSSFLVKALLFRNFTWNDYVFCVGLLFLVHGLLSRWHKTLPLTPDEELMR